jgi:4-hydroxyphenylpyruvate dioxygenase
MNGMLTRRFQLALGMSLVGKSDQSTGNAVYASYVLKSGHLVFTFTAPYSAKTAATCDGVPFPHYDRVQAHEFIGNHGMAVRALGRLMLPLIRIWIVADLRC